MMKTILVTGGTRGLGLAIVRRLHRDGFQVVATGRTLSPELGRLVETAGGAVRFRALDLADSKGIHDWVRALTTEAGHLYGLVNNAALGHDGVLATMHENQIHELISVNLTSTIILTKYCSRSMLLGGEGRIVNIASIIGFTGFNGLAVYAASKAGLLGFTRSLARELGKARITVNAVAPGYMQTDMTSGLQGEKLESIKRRSPLGRLATPDDAAGAVAFLLSADAASVTGTTMTVDAGSTA